MRKAAIIYFSGTGNTKFVADNLSVELRKNNIKADLFNIESDIIIPDEYDYIIIGGPVYVERYDEILLKYLEKNLKKYKGKCMLYTTQVLIRPTAAFQHAANRLDFLDISYCQVVPMPNNFYNFMFEKTSDEDIEKVVKNSVKLCAKAVKNFMQGRKQFYHKNGIWVKMVDATYKAYYLYFAHYMRKKITIDYKKCVKCKLCEKRCPVKAVKIDRDIVIGTNCILCQRCMNRCPKGAFLYKDEPFIQYKPDFKK